MVLMVVKGGREQSQRGDPYGGEAEQRKGECSNHNGRLKWSQRGDPCRGEVEQRKGECSDGNSRHNHLVLSSLSHLVSIPSTLSSLPYAACELGKPHWASFPSNIHLRCTTSFELIHFNIWGSSLVLFDTLLSSLMTILVTPRSIFFRVGLMPFMYSHISI